MWTRLPFRNNMKGEEEEEWGVFGRPYPGAGGQDGSVALAQLYLVDHGMFIYLTPFSLQKIPAFSLPFFFFFPHHASQGKK